MARSHLRFPRNLCANSAACSAACPPLWSASRAALPRSAPQQRAASRWAPPSPQGCVKVRVSCACCSVVALSHLQRRRSASAAGRGMDTLRLGAVATTLGAHLVARACVCAPDARTVLQLSRGCVVALPAAASSAAARRCATRRHSARASGTRTHRHCGAQRCVPGLQALKRPLLLP